MRTEIFKRGVLIAVFAWFMLHGSALIAQVGAQLPDGFGTGGLQTSENLSSGVLNFSLPIENAILPVSIGYVTSGIRVTQRPGELGLGWYLQAGGFIAREKRGRADGEVNGYSGANLRGNLLSGFLTNANQYNDFHKNNYDSQPDVFQYNFLGQSGKFVIGLDRQAIHLTPTTLRIVPRYNASGYYKFDVWDASGTHYVFDIRENIDVKEINTSGNVVSNNSVNANYTHKWHITSVTDYATGSTIDFNYLSGSSYNYEEINTHNSRTLNGTSVENTKSTRIRTSYYPKLIGSVTKDDYEIEFEYTSRTDLSDRKKLSGIKYYNDLGLINSYSLQYTYLGSTQKRLMLSEVTKSSLGVVLYQFLYHGENGVGSVLPGFDSKSIDYWGFYNNNNSGTLYEGVSGLLTREPNLARTQANSLKSVIHTTGRIDEYAYELNSYMNDHDNNVLTAKIEENVGGLRIKSVTSTAVDGTGNSIVRNYDYDEYSANLILIHPTSGRVFANPVMSYDYYVEGANGRTMQSENSSENLSSPDGGHIVYKTVKVTNNDGSYSLNHFKTFDDISELHANEYEAKDSKALTSSGSNKNWRTGIVTNNGVTYHEGTFGPANYSGTVVGLSTATNSYDPLGNFVAGTRYNYEKKNATKTLTGYSFLTIASLSGSNSPIEVLYEEYEASNSYLRLTEVINTERPKNAQGSRSLTTSLTYHTDYPLVTVEESVTKRFIQTGQFSYDEYIDNDNKLRKETTYKFTQTTETAVFANNLIGYISEEKQFLGGVLQGRHTKDFSTTGGKYLPTNSKSYLNGELVSDENYSYAGGLMVESHDAIGDKRKAYTYDDYGRPIAAVNYATHESVAYSGFELSDLGNWSSSAPLMSNAKCLRAYNVCISSGGVNCSSQLSTCSSSVNLVPGRVGNALDLDGVSLSSTPGSGKHIISFWRRNGSVSIGGVTGRVLLDSYTEGLWTYEEHSFTATGNVTVSSSNGAFIDDLRMYEEGGIISTTNYHPIFGVSAKSDHNNNVIKYGYDAAGRRIHVLDRNDKVLEQTEYNIAEYITLAKRNNYSGYLPGTEIIDVTSNAPWTVSGLPGWITASTTSGSNLGSVELTIERNNNTSSGRTANITFTTSNGVSKVVTISQIQGVAPYLTVSTSTITLNSSGITSVPVLIQSNVSWTATITQGSGDLLLENGAGNLIGNSISGSGTDSMEVRLGLIGGGGGGSPTTYTGTVTISSSGLPSKTITVNYTTNSSNQQ